MTPQFGASLITVNYAPTFINYAPDIFDVQATSVTIVGKIRYVIAPNVSKQSEAISNLDDSIPIVKIFFCD